MFYKVEAFLVAAFSRYYFIFKFGSNVNIRYLGDTSPISDSMRGFQFYYFLGTEMYEIEGFLNTQNTAFGLENSLNIIYFDSTQSVRF